MSEGMTATEMHDRSHNTYVSRQEAINKLADQLCIQVIDILDKNMRSCLNCEKFDEQAELCKAFNARPPVRIMVKACGDWSYSEVPF